MLVLFHTAAANEETFSRMLAEMAPEIPVRHIVRKDLLDQALAEGGVSDALKSMTVEAMRSAATPGDIALCTCSTIGECADEAGWLRVDRPMARLAVKTGSRVLVAACLETTVGPTVRLIGDQGAKDVRTLLTAEAWPHWVNGDKETLSPAPFARAAATRKVWSSPKPAWLGLLNTCRHSRCLSSQARGPG